VKAGRDIIPFCVSVLPPRFRKDRPGSQGGEQQAHLTGPVIPLVCCTSRVCRSLSTNQPTARRATGVLSRLVYPVYTCV
jgi:hypothetical protein